MKYYASVFRTPIIGPGGSSWDPTFPDELITTPTVTITTHDKKIQSIFLQIVFFPLHLAIAESILLHT